MSMESAPALTDQMTSFQGPVFLIGMPRSGTKLLRNLLNGHSRISIPRVETEFLPFWVRTWSEYGDLSQPENFGRFYQDALKLPYFVFLKTGGSAIAQEVWYDLCRERNDFSPAGVFEVLIRHKTEVPWGSDTIWGDKSPSYISHIKLLKSLYPNARFIHIVRDVRDYSLSIQKAWGKHPVRAAQRWVDGIQAARRSAQAYSDSYLEVRYEDLLEQPQQVLEKCCALLGLEPEEGMIESASLNESRGDAKGYASIKQDNKQKYKTLMSPRLRQQIEQISSELLRHYGYETDYTGEPQRLSRSQMAYYQAIDGVNMVLSGFKRRGVLGSLSFQLRYFTTSGNRSS